MANANRYYQLITSLPLLQGKLGSDFEVMTRIGFDKKLDQLSEDDKGMVKELEDFLIWEKHSMDRATDSEFRSKAIALQHRYTNKTFLEIIKFATQRRLLLGLLRKRKNGLEQAPDSKEYWAFPEIEYNIKHYWNQTDFGLKSLNTNIAGVDTLLQDNQSLELEKQMMEMVWNYCDKLSHGHYFDIDFIMLYAIRRSIVQRWGIATTPQDITEKFERLAQEAIDGNSEEENN